MRAAGSEVGIARFLWSHLITERLFYPSTSLSICLPSQSVSAWMTDLLSITTTTTTTTKMLHCISISISLSLSSPPPHSRPVLLHLSLFLPDAETNAPWMDSSTCYIIRNRFYSLVLTISNAYCILLLVLPAISLSPSLCLVHLNFLHDRESSHTAQVRQFIQLGVATWALLGLVIWAVPRSCDVIRRFSGTLFLLPSPSLFAALKRLVRTEKSHTVRLQILRELTIPFT